MNLNETEINALIAKYSIGQGLINYSDFCANIDTVFVETANPTDIIENSKSTASFTDDEKDTLLMLLSAIRVEIKNKRILIKPQF